MKRVRNQRVKIKPVENAALEIHIERFVWLLQIQHVKFNPSFQWLFVVSNPHSSFVSLLPCNQRLIGSFAPRPVCYFHPLTFSSLSFLPCYRDPTFNLTLPCFISHFSVLFLMFSTLNSVPNRKIEIYSCLWFFSVFTQMQHNWSINSV